MSDFEGVDSHLVDRFKYSVYGLTLDSEVELPGLYPGTGVADAVVRYGPVPEELVAPTQRGAVFEVAERRLLIRPGAAGWRFLVSEGREIVVQHDQESDDPDLRIYLIAAGLGGLAVHRGWFPLHASAIEFRGRAVLFAGVSGVGKSSLVQEMLGRGYRLLTDDLSPLDLSGDAVRVQPGFPRIKLWSDRLEMAPAAAEGELEAFVVGPGEARRLERVRYDTPKYVLPIEDDAFCNRAIELGAIYILEASGTGPIEITPLRGATKLHALLENQFGSQALSVTALAGTSMVMELAGRLAEVGIVRVRRPILSNSQGEASRLLADTVEADLQRRFADGEVPLTHEVGKEAK